jgi:cysteine desulfurase/selenocysteine lyase
MERFGISATARASFYVYTIESDVDTLVQGLHKALEIFSI